MAFVTVRTEPYTVGIEGIQYVDGLRYFPTCSCGWQGVMLHPDHRYAKEDLRRHMITEHPVSNRRIVARLR